jgi:phosphatidylglycerophosphatase A
MSRCIRVNAVSLRPQPPNISDAHRGVERRKMKSIPGTTPVQKGAVCLATGFGIGLIAPFAPGTFGSLPGVVLALWLTRQVLPLQILACLGLALLAVPICGVAETVLGKKDDGRICADEWMLFPICTIGLPLLQHLWLVPFCFVVARLCDIFKPPPARSLQALHGGVGIVIDDFFASLYALALNHVGYRLILPFLTS